MWIVNGSKLENCFSSVWKFKDNNWTFTLDGVEVYIKNSLGFVLTIEDSGVELKEKDTSSANQKWIKSANDSEGRFTLRNPSSNKFLTNVVPKMKSDDENITIVEGMKQYVKPL